MKIKFIISFLLIYLSTSATSLYDCIDKALIQSYEIQNQKKNLEIAEKRLKSGYTNFIPNLSLFNQTSYAYENQEYNTNGLTLDEELYLFDNRIFNLNTYKISLTKQQLKYQTTRQDIILSVLESYLDILLFKEKINLHKELQTTYQKQLEYIRELSEVGSKNTLDIYSLQIEIKNNEISIKENSNNLAEVLETLNQKTKLNIKNYQQLDTLSLDLFKFKENYSFENNYSWQSKQADVKQSKINKNKDYYNLYPTLYLGGSLSYSETNSLESDFQLFEDEWQKNWEISLNLSYPLGNFAANYTEYKISSLLKQQKELELKNYQQTLTLDIKNQRNRVKLNQEKLNLQKEKLELARKKYLLSENRFEGGLIDFFAFKESANEFLAAKLSYLESRKAYIISIANWQKITGQKLLSKY